LLGLKGSKKGGWRAGYGLISGKRTKGGNRGRIWQSARGLATETSERGGTWARNSEGEGGRVIPTPKTATREGGEKTSGIIIKGRSSNTLQQKRKKGFRPRRKENEARRGWK